MTERKLTSLGVLAGKLNVSKSKLSYYDKLELIKPLYKTVSGMRIYDEDKTIITIDKIDKEQEKGTQLKDIKKKLPIRAITPILPRISITTNINMTLAAAK